MKSIAWAQQNEEQRTSYDQGKNDALLPLTHKTAANN